MTRLSRFGCLFAGAGPDCLLSFHFVVDDRTELHGVEVVLHEAFLRAPVVKRRTQHLPAIGQRLATWGQVEIEEVRLPGCEDAALVPR